MLSVFNDFFKTSPSYSHPLTPSPNSRVENAIGMLFGEGGELLRKA
jgi:hypothetical protein